MHHADLNIVDQREVAPGRIVDCGKDWNRAVELLAASELPMRDRQRRPTSTASKPLAR